LAAKKTSKKAAKKKPAAKKKSLKKVSPDVGFYVCDGSLCKDLFELSETIDKLADDMFKHHVNEMKNDFANWVEFVFEEPGLAKKLRKTKNKDRHVVEILRYVVKELK